MKILVRSFLLFILTLSFSLSISSVSNAEVFEDTTSQETPESENDSSETELEIEVSEASPLIQFGNFRLSDLSGLHLIGHRHKSFLDAYINSIDIPPSC